METKSIFRSRTFWVNVIPMFLAVIALIDPDLLTVFGIIGLNQTKALIILAFITSLLNIVLRSLTNTIVSFNPPKKLPLIIGFLLLSSIGFAQVTDSLKYWNMGKQVADGVGSNIPYYWIVGIAAPLIYGWAWHVTHLKKKLKTK